MTYPRLGQENLICAWDWTQSEKHQDLSWYTSALGSHLGLTHDIQSLADGMFTAYVCDTFNRPDAITLMEQKAFEIIYLNCGHTSPEPYQIDYPG